MSRNDRFLSVWLFGLGLLVVVMIMVGGLTRMTQSGLSIVEWNLVTGVMPPLSEGQWQIEFAKYQQSPQFIKINHQMNRDEFKAIYWWEWGHRFLGRLIGIVYLLPLLILTMRRRLQERRMVYLWLGFGLVVVQGIVGWYMVKSGLVNDPLVSHYRLATHLFLALLLLLFLLWQWLDLNFPPLQKNLGWSLPSYLVAGLFALIAVQMIFGAFTAGLRAGHGFNTFPKMGTEWFPYHFAAQESWVSILIASKVGVQFVHRTLGLVIGSVAFGCWWVLIKNFKSQVARSLLHYMLLSVWIQIILGIVTLVKVVPISWASAHQWAGVNLLVSVFLLFYWLTYREPMRDAVWAQGEPS